MIPIQVRDTEKTALKLLKPALETALYEADIEFEIPADYTGIKGFYGHNLKINKLAFAAIEEFDLPLLRTWYKYGQYEPYDVLRPKRLELEDHRGEEQTYVPSGLHTDVQLEHLIEYLLDRDLESMFDMDLFEFLISNYEEWDPAPFTEAYIASTRIIRVLEQLHSSSPEEVLNQVDDLHSEFKDASIDFRYQIDTTDAFSNDIHAHTELYLRCLEEALATIDDSSELDADKQSTLMKGRGVYHEYVLPWTALTISINRAEGPTESLKDFQQGGLDMLQTDRAKYETHLKGWQTELEEASLTTTWEQYESLGTSAPEAILQLQRAALDDH